MGIGSLLNQAGGASAIARKLGVDEATVERGANALFPTLPMASRLKLRTRRRRPLHPAAGLVACSADCSRAVQAAVA
jgi:hypothetical protein